MADSIQRQIMDAVKTRTDTILVANSYKTDIGSNVFRWKSKDWEPADMPGVSIKDPETPITIFKMRSSGGVWEHRTRVEFQVAVQLADNSSNQDVADKVRDAIDDIYTMIGTDQTWSGLALWTSPVDHSIDVIQEDKTYGGGNLKVDIVYRTLAFNTETTG